MLIYQSFTRSLFLLSILFSGVITKAQSKFSGGIRLGYEVANAMPAFGLNVEYAFKSRLSARVSFIKFGNSSTSGQTNLNPKSSSLNSYEIPYTATKKVSAVEVSARLFLGRNREVAAKGFYFAAGLGVVFGKTSYSIPPYDPDNYYSSIKDGDANSYVDPIIALGLGGEFKVADRIYIGPELMLYLPVTEVDDTQVEVNFGFGLLPSVTARYTLFDDQPKRKKNSRGSSSSKSKNSRKPAPSRRR